MFQAFADEEELEGVEPSLEDLEELGDVGLDMDVDDEDL